MINCIQKNYQINLKNDASNEASMWYHKITFFILYIKVLRKYETINKITELLIQLKDLNFFMASLASFSKSTFSVVGSAVAIASLYSSSVFESFFDFFSAKTFYTIPLVLNFFSKSSRRSNHVFDV